MQPDRLPRGVHEEVACDRRQTHTYRKRNVVDRFDGGAGKRDTTQPLKMLVGGNPMKERVRVRAKREMVGVEGADGAMNMSSQVRRCRGKKEWCSSITRPEKCIAGN